MVYFRFVFITLTMLCVLACSSQTKNIDVNQGADFYNLPKGWIEEIQSLSGVDNKNAATNMADIYTQMNLPKFDTNAVVLCRPFRGYFIDENKLSFFNCEKGFASIVKQDQEVAGFLVFAHDSCLGILTFKRATTPNTKWDFMFLSSDGIELTPSRNKLMQLNSKFILLFRYFQSAYVSFENVQPKCNLTELKNAGIALETGDFTIKEADSTVSEILNWYQDNNNAGGGIRRN